MQGANATMEQDRAFPLPSGVKVYGGFDPDNGIRTMADKRILPVPGKTSQGSILSGDLNGDGTLSAYHVVISSGNTETAVLDGFTITGAKATGANNTVTVNGKTVHRRYGGGIHIVDSPVELSNLNIISNTSTTYGAGVYVVGSAAATPSTLNMNRCIVSNNTTTNSAGGGIYVAANVTSAINNSLIVKNSAGTATGGGIHMAGTTLNLTHVTFADNAGAATSTAVNRAAGTVRLYNTIVSGTVGGTVTHNSSLYTGATAIGNPAGVVSIDEPQFVDESVYDYTLMPVSSAVNAGNNTYADGMTEDLAGNARLLNGAVDLGAYELAERAVTPDATGIVYVKDYGTATIPADADGSSWEKAYPNLSEPLRAASRVGTDIDSIFVAKGTYKPLYRAGNGTPKRTRAFVLVPDIKIYGGFDPDNNIRTLADKRILPGHIAQGSILSGDLNGNDPTITDNVYHVVISAGEVGAALLDGFSIVGGNANVSGNITVNAQMVNNLYGGGIYISGSSPILRNINISANAASYFGAGIYQGVSSSLDASHIAVVGNTAGRDGAGIYNAGDSSLKIKNGLIVKNTTSTSYNGGGLYSTGANSVVELTSVTIADNTAIAASTAIHNASGTVNVSNSIVMGKVSGTVGYNYSLLEGGTLAAGTIVANDYPQFTDPTNNNYGLDPASPAIDMGDNTLIAGIAADMAGNPRIHNSVVDLGAYESQKTIIIPDAEGIVYVRDYEDKTVPTDADGSSWEKAYPNLDEPLLAAARSTSGIDSIFVTVGTYTPLFRVGSGTLEQDRTFLLAPDVKVYGGFDPDNDIRTLADQRILPTSGDASQGSVLSGFLTADSTVMVYHVLVSVGNVGTAALDGFSITGGSAKGTGTITVYGKTVNRNYGSGIFITNSAPTLRNLSIDFNNSSSYGAGIFAIGTAAEPASLNLSRSSVTNNTSGALGGGIYIAAYTTSTMSNNLILANASGNNSGGGIYINANALLTIDNSVIAGNSSGTATGGGIYAGGTSLTMTHVTIANNIGAAASTGVIRAAGTVVFNNSIITDKVSGTVTYNSCLYTGATAVGNPAGIVAIDNPQFVSEEAYDYSLMPISPAVDAGNNAYATMPFDLADNPRIYNNAVDLGAYESQKRAVVNDADGIVYVKDYGTAEVPEDADGSSWEKAYPNLSDPILSASRFGSEIDSIFVAVGTYKPIYRAGNGTVARTRSFLLPKDVKIYGGFDPDKGIRTLEHARILPKPDEIHGSILSGDLNGNDPVITDNVYHVVISAGNVGTTVLDGFSITGGNANVSSTNVVNGQTITNRYGGGIYVSASAPTLRNVKVYKNTAALYGGGIYSASASSVTASHLLAISNTATRDGAGIYNTGNSAVKISNGLIARNGAGTSYNGGGIYTTGTTSAVDLTNVTIADNTSTAASTAIYHAGGATSLYNSIVMGKVTGTISYSYSLLQGGTLADGTIVSNADPQFVDASSLNYRLEPGSPAIDLGSNALATGIEVDQDGNGRIYNDVVDLGAYEVIKNPIVPDADGIVYVKDYGEETVPVGADGSSWEKAYPNLSDPLHEASRPASEIDSIFVAVGSYTPLYRVGTGTVSQDRTFLLAPDVKIYGGFDPDNDIRTLGDDRILPIPGDDSQGSILNGYLSADSTVMAYHVVMAAGDVGKAMLDGFTITGGSATGSGSNSVNGKTMSRTYGGGVLIKDASPLFRNMNIYSNKATTYGGGICVSGSSATPIVFDMNYSSVIANTASNSGGGIYVGSYTTSEMHNSLITDNTSGSAAGGGVYYAGTSLVATHMTIANNKGATASTALYRSAGTVTLNNSIITGTVAGTVTYNTCLYTGATAVGSPAGVVAIDDPMFMSEEAYDYSLQPVSLAVDAGNNAYATMDIDLAGNPRIYNNAVDLGAYESQKRAVVPDEDGIVYVKDYGNNTVPEDADGSSWELAYPNLSDPLLSASRFGSEIDSIFVAIGTYKPIYRAGNGTVARTRSFLLPKDVKIYGGFDPDNGISTLDSVRILPRPDDFERGSILSGDLNANDPTITDNVYHVVISAGNVGTTVLDGFSITGGNANVNSTNVVNGNTITNRYGGGIFIIASAPTLRNVMINKNTAALYGGGAYLASASSLTASHLSVVNNTATRDGAGIYNTGNSAVKISNGLIARNTSGASYNGGGIYTTGTTSAVDLTQVTIASNTSVAASTAIYRASGTVVLKNSIITGKVSGTVTYTNSLYQGGTLGAGTIISNADPQFMAPSSNDFRLEPGSPAIDLGDNALAAGIELDQDGYQRVFNGVVDLGAYEVRKVPIVADAEGIVYVKDYGTNPIPADANGSSWELAYPDLSEPLHAASRPASDIDSIFVAVGVYRPLYRVGTTTTSKDRTFLLAPNVKIYGGFDPDNDIRSLDDKRIMPVPGDTELGSVLSGYLTADSTAMAYHVVMALGDVGTAALDGFSISGGYASATTNNNINGLSVNRSYGGGMYIQNASPVLRNLNIDSNKATYGGGMYVTGSAEAPSVLNLSHSSVTGNTSTNLGGGIRVNTNVTANISNSLIAGNASGTASGGGIATAATATTLNQVTIADNTGAAASTALYRSAGTVTINNSIIVGKVGGTVTYNTCLYTGANAVGDPVGIVSIDDPMFINSEAFDYRLLPVSMAVDAGNNANAVGTVDLEGNPRIYNNVVDLGAYESQKRAVKADANGIVYVKDYGTTTAPEEADGSSWELAYPNLSDPLIAASRAITDINTIYVAKGTYIPLYRSGNGKLERDRTFTLVKNINVYGGFDPDNGIRVLGDKRIMPRPDDATRGSILSGDLYGTGKARVHHVVLSIGDVGTATLDGFTITKGLATGSGTIKVSGQTLNRRYAGGMYLVSSSPAIRNVNIRVNEARNYGGGMYLTASSPVLSHVSVVNNKSRSHGAGIYNTGLSNVKIINGLIANNSVTGSAYGGGIYTSGTAASTFETVNTTIANNKAVSSTTAIYRGNGVVTLKNNIIVGTVSGTVTYSNTLREGIAVTTAGIVSNATPQFIAPTSNDFRLEPGSPAIDLGDNTLAAGIAVDLDGNDRIFNDVIDLGAYELRKVAVVPDANGIVYVKDYEDAIVPDDANGSSWEKAYPNLSEPLHAAARTTSGIDSIFVATGVYTPLYRVGTGTQAQDRTFLLAPNVKVYGGFAPDNNIRTLADKRIMPVTGDTESGSVLSGYLSADSTLMAYHVVISSGNVGTAVLDGFTITGGNAKGSSTVNIEGESISRTYGGGIYIRESAPTLRNLNIDTNKSKSYGAGIYVIGSSGSPSKLNLSHSSVVDNATTRTAGGGIYISSYTTSEISNSVIAGNSSGTAAGGGIYTSTTLTLNHVTIADNKGATASTALYRGGGTVTFQNSIIIGRVGGSVTYKNSMYSSATAVGNPAGIVVANEDPMFANNEARDYSLLPLSPAVDKGDNTYTTATVDLAGNPRIFNVKSDLGAYEVQRRAVAPDANGIVYVKDYKSAAVPDEADGSSWELAYPNLSDPLLTITRGTNTDIDSIFVAVGTYTPHYRAGNGKTERDRAFVLLPNIHIYGGFDPENDIRTLADKRVLPVAYDATQGSILSGALKSDGKTHSYHVVISTGNVGTAVLDGFTITDGKANGNNSYITVNKQTVRRRYGGGVYMAASSPNLNNLNVASNISTYYGAGIYMTASSPAITSVAVIGNKTSYSGAGIYNVGNSSPVLKNILIAKNSSGRAAGGGIYLSGTKSTMTLHNATIIDNVGATASASIYRASGKISMTNSIVFGRVSGSASYVTYTHSLVELAKTIDGVNVISNVDPMFVDRAGGNYRLLFESPAIDLGQKALYPGLDLLTTRELSGKPRVGGLEIDLGAYEYHEKNKWIGRTNTAWKTGTNWLMNIPLENFEELEFDENAVNDLVIKKDERYTVAEIVNQSNKKLRISGGAALTTTGIVSLKDNTSLIVGAGSATVPNATFIYPQGVTVNATVEMFSKAYVDQAASPNDMYKWQYIGVPVSGTKASASFAGSYLRRWNETGTNDAANYYWTEMTGNDDLVPFVGYEVTSKTASKTYTFRGELVNADYSKTFARTSGAKYEGQHVISNPYTAGLEISEMNFDGGLEETVYLFNTGSHADWQANDGSSASASDAIVAGKFVAIPKNHAGTAGLLSRIPSMQGYVVKLLSGQNTGTLSFGYAGAVGNNTAAQRVAPVTAEETELPAKVYTVVDVIGETAADRLWIFTEANTTRGYDNGWDGRKVLSGNNVTQIYAAEADGNYQVNTVPSINNTQLAFVPGAEGEFTLRFTHENTAEIYAAIYLLDLERGTVTDITDSGTEYKFTATSSDSLQKRFRIVTNEQTTDLSDSQSVLSIYTENRNIYALNKGNGQGELYLFDLSGRILGSRKITPYGMTVISGYPLDGVYIVKAVMENNSETVTEKVIIK
ncbi:choice-of-anchor Q domain-containing protein [Paludibacter sp. 221]|uniref:choice-of-anchor Q domain-containing protein n=1 Tax=Paludibacter sp. 221 TaxID=2302939 RepID=UPI00351B98F4